MKSAQLAQFYSAPKAVLPLVRGLFYGDTVVFLLITPRDYKFGSTLMWSRSMIDVLTDHFPDCFRNKLNVLYGKTYNFSKAEYSGVQ